MFASATSGERPNNSKFSNCSKGNISSVLDAIEEGKKKNCFTGNPKHLRHRNGENVDSRVVFLNFLFIDSKFQNGKVLSVVTRLLRKGKSAIAVTTTKSAMRNVAILEL